MFKQAPSFPYHDLGIVEDGNTASRAISKDAYVIWKGSSYFASTDILQGATLEEDVNLTAIPDGVINGVVEALNSNLYPEAITVAGSGSTKIIAYKMGSMCTLMAIGNGTTISSSGLQLPESLYPKYNVVGAPAARYSEGWKVDIWLRLRDTGKLYTMNGNNEITVSNCLFSFSYELANP